MKSISVLLTALIVAGWIGAIAILSVQNFSPVALKFLNWQSVEIPVGLVLAFAVGVGIVATAIAQFLFIGGSSATNFEED